MLQVVFSVLFIVGAACFAAWSIISLVNAIRDRKVRKALEAEKPHDDKEDLKGGKNE